MPVDYSYTDIKDANNTIDEATIEPSNLETIDYAFYNFVNEEMEIRARTNKGWKKVPVLWASPERAFFAKEKKELYDLDGTLIYPIISVEKTSISKNLDKKGIYYGAPSFMDDPHHGGRIMLGRRIVQDKTTNFSVADNRKKFENVYRTPQRANLIIQRLKKRIKKL